LVIFKYLILFSYTYTVEIILKYLRKKTSGHLLAVFTNRSADLDINSYDYLWSVDTIIYLYRCDARRYLTDGDAAYPLILYGPSGSGKTTVMAAIAKQCHLWNQDAAVVVRFANASAYSLSLEQTLNSLVVQLNLVDNGKCTWYKHVSFISKRYILIPFYIYFFHTAVIFRTYNCIRNKLHVCWVRLDRSGRLR